MGCLLRKAVLFCARGGSRDEYDSKYRIFMYFVSVLCGIWGVFVSCIWLEACLYILHRSSPLVSLWSRFKFYQIRSNYQFLLRHKSCIILGQETFAFNKPVKSCAFQRMCFCTDPFRESDPYFLPPI